MAGGQGCRGWQVGAFQIGKAGQGQHGFSPFGMGSLPKGEFLFLGEIRCGRIRACLGVILGAKSGRMWASPGSPGCLGDEGVQMNKWRIVDGGKALVCSGHPVCSVCPDPAIWSQAFMIGKPMDGGWQRTWHHSSCESTWVKAWVFFDELETLRRVCRNGFWSKVVIRPGRQKNAFFYKKCIPGEAGSTGLPGLKPGKAGSTGHFISKISSLHGWHGADLEKGKAPTGGGWGSWWFMECPKWGRTSGESVNKMCALYGRCLTISDKNKIYEVKIFVRFIWNIRPIISSGKGK